MKLAARWHDEGVNAPPLVPRVLAEASDLIVRHGMCDAEGVARYRSRGARSPDARAFYVMVLNALQGES
jgi:hypothetical protein